MQDSVHAIHPLLTNPAGRYVRTEGVAAWPHAADDSLRFDGLTGTLKLITELSLSILRISPALGT